MATNGNHEASMSSSRAYPSPTKIGKVPFKYPKLNVESETAYFLWGDLSSNKTPLICLHGGPGIPHSYMLSLCLINSDHGIPVLMYDQIGCGESTAFPSKKHDASFWTDELFMAELDNLKSYLGITEFDLLGQSWGGMLAGHYAIKQPKGLRKLINEGGPDDIGLYEKAVAKLRAQLPREMLDALDKGERDNNLEDESYKKAEYYFYTQHICRMDIWPPEVLSAFEKMEADPTVYHTMMGPNEFLVQGTLKNWSIRDELHKITEKTIPGGMLIVNGAHDTVQDETISAFFSKPSCKVKWVRYGGGHLPLVEEVDKFIRDLGMFLMDE